jgi:uncharacterized membrane protein YkvI
MTRDKKAISTPHSGLMGGLMCGLLVFTGVFCLCNPVNAASDTLPQTPITAVTTAMKKARHLLVIAVTTDARTVIPMPWGRHHPKN